MIVLNLKYLSHDVNSICVYGETLENIRSIISDRFGLSENLYFLKSNGRIVSENKDLNGNVEAVPKLFGGKGGFGSMLRAIGAQIEKTTNREACRDLSGRRLRDINEEQRLKKWITQQAEREREIEERKKRKLEKLSKQPKHEFKDEVYDSERADLTEKLSDSVEQGFKVASTSSLKRKIDTQPKEVKTKKKMLMDFEELSSSDEEKEANGENTVTESKRKINGSNAENGNQVKEEKKIKKKKKILMDFEEEFTSSDEENDEEVKPPKVDL